MAMKAEKLTISVHIGLSFKNHSFLYRKIYEIISNFLVKKGIFCNCMQEKVKIFNFFVGKSNNL